MSGVGPELLGVMVIHAGPGQGPRTQKQESRTVALPGAEH